MQDRNLERKWSWLLPSGDVYARSMYVRLLEGHFKHLQKLKETGLSEEAMREIGAVGIGPLNHRSKSDTAGWTLTTDNPIFYIEPPHMHWQKNLDKKLKEYNDAQSEN